MHGDLAAAPDGAAGYNGTVGAQPPTSADLRRRVRAAVERAGEVSEHVAANVSAALEIVDQLTGDLAAARDKVANLEIALQSARRIGMAMGIIMGRFGLTEDEAFARLRTASQHTQRKLRDIAEDVILRGELPRWRPEAQTIGAP